MAANGAPVAVIDLGTNTVLLLVGHADEDGRLTVLADVHASGRLGQGVDGQRRVQPQAVERVRSILLEHRARARRLGAQRIVAYGTSALRDAANRTDVCSAVETWTGIPLHVLSGDEEARLTFTGAAYGLKLPAHYAVIDIGGGSTELAVGETGGVVRRASVDIGAVRLTERHFSHLPPGSLALAEARRTVTAELARLPAPDAAIPLVGVAGTVTTLGALDMGIANFDAEQLNGHVLSARRVTAFSKGLLSLSHAEIRRLPQVNQQRADLITAGSVILDTALGMWHRGELIVSTRGLRYGLLQHELGLVS